MQNKYLAPVIQQESGGNPMAISPKGAAGIMQIMPDTARDPGFGVTPLQGWDGKDPRTAPVHEQIRFGNDYLNAMSKKYGGDTSRMLAAYNAGPGNVDKYGGVPPFKETQEYVQKVGGAQVTSNSDWRSRARVVQPAQATQPIAQPTAQPVAQTAQASDWRSRAKVVAPAGQDMGAGTAAVQGFNSTVPFGERMTAGLGATGAYLYDKATGLSDNSLGDYYDEARNNQQVTAENNSGSYLLGGITGVAATLPMASTKVLTGTKATTGLRGAVNAVPEALASVGNFVRGGTVGANAGRVAKATNLAGKAARSAIVAAPASALYAYGSSKNDLLSKEAVDDAASGARVGAALGAALPVAGAALKSTVLPKVSEEIGALAKRAKDFGIDVSLDQISKGKVRSKLQTLSQSVPFSGVDAFQEKQTTQWHKQLAKTIGQESDNLSPETIKQFIDDAATGFESIVKHTDIKTQPKSIDDLKNIVDSARENITSDYASIVQGKAEKLANELFKVRNVKSGLEYSSKPLTGKKLASIRSQLIKDLPNVAGDARTYVSELVDYIDDIAGKNLAKEDVVKLDTVRRQWRNYKTLEPLLEKSTDGNINPTELMNQVAKSKYIKASRKSVGEDDLVDLARIGKQFMRVKEGSDTAIKSAYIKGASGVGAAGAGYMAPVTTGSMIAANRAYQSLINNSPAMVNRAINGGAGNAKALPIADMLAAQAAGKVERPRLQVPSRAERGLPPKKY